MPICNSIVKLETKPYGDLLEVKISDGVTALWLYDYTKALEFVGRDVIVSYRQDLMDNIECTFINTFTVPSVVNTLEQASNVRLYVEDSDNKSNVSFRSIKVGEVAYAARTYCLGMEKGSSAAANWVELTLRDACLRTAKCKIFDCDPGDINYVGSYVQCNLRKSKYGLQVDNESEVVLVETVAQENAEIPVCKAFIENFLKQKDPATSTYIENIKLIEHLEKTLDYERGYSIVRLAQELYVSQQLENLTDAVSVTTIIRAIVSRYLYVTIPNNHLSKLVRNVLACTKAGWTDVSTVIACIDDLEETEQCAERKIVNAVIILVDNLIENRKSIK